MKKYNYIFYTILVFLFLGIRCAKAASLSVSGGQPQMQSSDEYNVSVTLSINVASGSAYYLRGVFYKPNSTDYCGYTWNGDTWFNGPYSTNEGWKSFLPITIDQNKWSGQLKAKIDSKDNGCKDSGIYNFKIQRFTVSGSSSFDQQGFQSIEIAIPTPSFTPTPTSKPDPTQKNIYPTSSEQEVLPSQDSSQIAQETEAITPSMQTSVSGVLGIETIDSPTLSQHKDNKAVTKTKSQARDIFAIVLVCIGIILVFLCGIVMFLLKKRGVSNEKTTHV